MKININEVCIISKIRNSLSHSNFHPSQIFLAIALTLRKLLLPEVRENEHKFCPLVWSTFSYKRLKQHSKYLPKKKLNFLLFYRRAPTNYSMLIEVIRFARSKKQHCLNLYNTFNQVSNNITS